jgi:hypothetical protein
LVIKFSRKKYSPDIIDEAAGRCSYPLKRKISKSLFLCRNGLGLPKTIGFIIKKGYYHKILLNALLPAIRERKTV